MADAGVGKELRDLRSERVGKLTQEDLARLSGVGITTIKKIELGQTNPQPATLGLLARGLASDADGKVNHERSEAYYRRLMNAAGHGLGTEDALLTKEDVSALLTRITGQREVAVAFSEVIDGYARMSPQRRRAIEETAKLLARDIERAREQGES